MTATRRHPDETPRLHGEIPRRHRGVVVVNLFNADRAPVSPIGDQARFSRGRRHTSRSLAGDCFTYAGLERDSSHVPRCDGAFAGACPHSLRWHESELERRNRELLEENDALRRTLMRGVR